MAGIGGCGRIARYAVHFFSKIAQYTMHFFGKIALSTVHLLLNGILFLLYFFLRGSVKDTNSAVIVRLLCGNSAVRVGKMGAHQNANKSSIVSWMWMLFAH